jgi:hypothetical protein
MTMSSSNIGVLSASAAKSSIVRGAVFRRDVDQNGRRDWEIGRQNTLLISADHMDRAAIGGRRLESRQAERYRKGVVDFS